MCVAVQQQQPATVAYLPRYIHPCAKDLGTRYAEHMLVIYGEAAQHGKPNLMCTSVILPSHLQFQEWSSIAHMECAKETV